MSNKNLAQDLLIEIGCEELPPKHLKKIQDSFAEAISHALHAEDLNFQEIQSFSTPRRLAVYILALDAKQPIRQIIKRGPAKNAALDEKGHFTKAALGFAEACGVSVEALSWQTTDKGTWLSVQQEVVGQSTETIIIHLLPEILKHFPAGKRMRWGNNTDTFLRPVHWIVLLLGNKPIAAEIYGIKTSNITYGHRFHHPTAIPLNHPSEYEAALYKGFVIADFNKRRKKIEDLLQQKDKQYKTIIEENLLDEVTGLIEWPVVLLGSFEESFLEMPPAVLEISMQTHQKCFPVIDSHKKLCAKFLIVSNIESKNPALVVAGNERVMSARLADAAFYYQEDIKISLENRRKDLKQIRFHQGLGTLWDKSERLIKLAEEVAVALNVDVNTAKRAALLCKADLLTYMVGEFPELQGIMGYYYGQHDKESHATLCAIKEHYYPRFAQDKLPDTKEACAIALADRMDSLMGLFDRGNRPTGDKDPFGLRRQALGLLRILIEKALEIDLAFLCQSSQKTYELPGQKPLQNSNIIQEVIDFCFERLKAWYQEQGVSPQVFAAVCAQRITHPLDFDRRIKAVTAFISLPEAQSLAAANKRVKNILAKSAYPTADSRDIDQSLLKEAGEIALWQQLTTKQQAIVPLLKDKKYEEILKQLAPLQIPIDHFFDQVMVMAEDENLRNNRLRLLQQLRNLFLEIADISLL